MGWFRAAAVNNVILRKQINTPIHPNFSFHSFSKFQHSNQFCFNYSYKSYCTNVTPKKYLKPRKVLKNIKFSNRLSKVPEIIKMIREPFIDNPYNLHQTCKIVARHSVRLASTAKNRYCHLAEAVLQLYEELIAPAWSYEAKRQHAHLMEPIIIHYRFFNYTHKVIELYQRCKLIHKKIHRKIIVQTVLAINSPIHKDIILEIRDGVFASKTRSKSIYDALYITFRRLKMDREAKGVLSKMKVFGLTFTKRIYLMLIQDCRGNSSKVKNIFNQMKENGVPPQIRHYAALADIQENITTNFVVELMTVLEQEQITPDLYYFNKIMQKYLQQGELKNALKIVRNLSNYGLEPNIATYTYLMDYYARVGDWDSFTVLLGTVKKDNSKIDRVFMAQYIRLMNAHDRINLKSLMELMDIVATNQISLKRKLLGEVAKCFKSTESLPELDFFLGYLDKIGICVTVEVINECLCNIVQRSDITNFDVLRITHFIEKQDSNFNFHSNDIHLPLLYAVVKMNSGETMIQELFSLAKEKGIQINTKYQIYGLIGVTKNPHDRELLQKSLKTSLKPKNPLKVTQKLI